jgi:hypothetical protein
VATACCKRQSPLMAAPLLQRKRFWYPRGGEISLADDGLLLDQGSYYAKYAHTDALTFEAIVNGTCLVLRGERGIIGKSETLKTEFEAVKASLDPGAAAATSFDLRDSSSEDSLEGRERPGSSSPRCGQ